MQEKKTDRHQDRHTDGQFFFLACTVAIRNSLRSNKKGGVVEVAQDVVDAVDRFTAPAGFVKKCASTQTRAGTGGNYRL